MTTLETRATTTFPAALAAPGRAPEIPAEADLYGWLIGSWDLEVRHYWTDVSHLGLRAEAHFAWVLEGRAVQDVWIMPPAGERQGLDPKLNTYGTTLRVWDPALEAWRVTWINPATHQRGELIGRWSGADVVQLGTRGTGTPVRWIFSEITPDSFRWTGESLAADGRSWTLEGEYRARRRG